MKKIITIVTLVALLAVSVFACVACQPNDNTDDVPVQIKYEADASAIIPLFKSGKAEYAVIGEPAVTNLTNMMSKNGITIYNCFNLQTLWADAVGASNSGYPQASVIVKKELLSNKAFVEALAASLQANADYLAQNAATVGDTLGSVGSTLAGTKFTAELVARCNLKFIKANDSAVQTEINTYLAEFGYKADGDKPNNKLPDNGFYCGFDGADSAAAPAKVSVYAPDGAPALALAKIIADGKIGDTTAEVTLATGENVIAKAVSGEADVVVLPTNAAATVYNNTKGNYQLFSVNVYGVLYLVSTHNITSLSDLNGKLVYSIGMGNTPEYVFKKILDKANVSYVNAD